MLHKVEVSNGGPVVYFEEHEPAGRGGRAPAARPTLPTLESALADVQRAAEVVFKAFKEANNPQEIELGLALKFSGAAGFIFTTEAEATFSVKLKWQNPKA